MIIVSKSVFTCGACGTQTEIEWDLDFVDSYEKDMGIYTYYKNDVEVRCERCGNVVLAKLWAMEYPPGNLEDSDVDIKRDDSQKSTIDTPRIEFFDL